MRREVLQDRARQETRRLAALALAGLALLAVLVATLEPAPAPEAARPETTVARLPAPELVPAPSFGALPDFAAIADTAEKKRRFFAWLLPMVEHRNAEILALRRFLVAAAERQAAGGELLPEDLARLERIGDRYRVPLAGEADAAWFERVLRRADVLPPSLVLAQAALESAWGTSRFARRANSLFGEWCFREGCGVVPRHRPDGASHEVEAFDAVHASVVSYFRNLNTLPAYAELRALRAEARARGAPLRGDALAAGLLRYSALADAYVDEVRSIIRGNGLAAYDGARRERPSSSAG